MFKQQKGKNAFLLKKNQEKQKAQEQLKTKQLTLKLQKNIRTFLARRRLAAHALNSRSLPLSLLLRTPLQQYSREEVAAFVTAITAQGPQAGRFYLLRLVLGEIQNPELFSLCAQVLEEEGNGELRRSVFAHPLFMRELRSLLAKGKAARLLDLSADQLVRTGSIRGIESRTLLSLLLRQFSEGFVEVESPHGTLLSTSSLRVLLQTIAQRKEPVDVEVDLKSFAELVLQYLRLGCAAEQAETASFLLGELMRVGAARHAGITGELVKENQALIGLVEDEELLRELEGRLRQSELLEEFTNHFLGLMERMMNAPEVQALFHDPRCPRFTRTLLAIIAELAALFEDRRLIFVRALISSDPMLRNLRGSQDPLFFEGLKMRLLAMDDEEFAEWGVFGAGEWQRVLENCVATADTKIQKMVEKALLNQVAPPKLVPFQRRNNDELELKTVVDLLTNLHKKSLRTRKLDPTNFVSPSLSAALQGFLFGKGARRVELLLRQLPFVFSFESRMRKLQEVVKEDKKNYDRSLFLQEEVGEELIIAVRRGNEFQDAYEACMTRDLRKKYKIIFFNQQGLEEEGVDGGGIIKEFINRVLRASFSQNYGLFLETPRNEILPDPHSPFTAEYEFVGRLVGKAVYEGINIEQKFAEPFLNLVIGRQNTFEDLQFIDPDVYRGLLSLKRTTDDVAALEQTFVIFDKLPNGKSSYVDLLCPSKPPLPAHRQTLVTNENKMQFVMSYADFKCNRQIEEKTRLFRRGFLKVMKPEWLTMFSNQELNAIISGDSPDFNVEELRANTVYNDYHEKDATVVAFWEVLREMSCEEKSLFLLYVTSCSRPPTLGFAALKPKLCLNRDNDPSHLPTANTCMNVLRLPNYQNKALLRSKLLYAITARAGFEFA